MRKRQRQRDAAFLITYISALALMALAMVMMPRPALSEPYQVPDLPIFTKPIPYCVHVGVALQALAATHHRLSWSGLHEAHDSKLSLFEHHGSGTWFLVEVKADSVLACIRARGNESRLRFGELS